jgi:hypothetical protein
MRCDVQIKRPNLPIPITAFMQKPSSKFSAPSKNKRPKKTGRMLGDGEFERLKRTSMTYQKVSVSGEFKKCSEEWVRQLTSREKTNGVVNLFPSLA